MGKRQLNYKDAIDELEIEKRMNEEYVKNINLLRKSNNDLKKIVDILKSSLESVNDEFKYYDKILNNLYYYQDKIDSLNRTIERLKKEKQEYSYLISVMLDSDKKC